MTQPSLREAERRLQPRFRKTFIFRYLLLAGLILGFAALIDVPGRSHLGPPQRIALKAERIALPRLATVGARLAGAWSLRAADRRFGGLSGLASDGRQLVAVTDSGSVLRFDVPTAADSRVTLRDLPAVAGAADLKVGRDSEAILRDPSGRGWWVAFEQKHALLLYDRDFTRLIERRPLAGASLAPNRGVEAIYADVEGALVALPESSGATDAVRLADGRLLLIERTIGFRGLSSRIIGPGIDLALPLGTLDNPEGIAATPLPKGGTRLWIVTDDDFQARRRTLLFAIDLVANGRARPIQMRSR